MPFAVVVLTEGDCIEALKPLNLHDVNMILYVCGSAMNALLKHDICDSCQKFFFTNPIQQSSFKTYLKLRDLGGLKIPNYSVFNAIANCELIYRRYTPYILRNDCSKLIDKIIQDISTSSICFSYTCQSMCTSILHFIVKHYFKIRSYAVVSLSYCRKRRSIMYGTATPKRRKVSAETKGKKSTAITSTLTGPCRK